MSDSTIKVKLSWNISNSLRKMDNNGAWLMKKKKKIVITQFYLLFLLSVANKQRLFLLYFFIHLNLRDHFKCFTLGLLLSCKQWKMIQMWVCTDSYYLEHLGLCCIPADWTTLHKPAQHLSVDNQPQQANTSVLICLIKTLVTLLANHPVFPRDVTTRQLGGEVKVSVLNIVAGRVAHQPGWNLTWTAQHKHTHTHAVVYQCF